MKNRSTPDWVYLLLAGSGIFMLVTLLHYPGRGYIYVVFSVLLNALLFFGFRRGSIFFDTFLGVFFWIGFWLKFSVRTVFADGIFHESVGYFDYSAEAYDKALLVTSCGIAGLLCARLIRQQVLFESLADVKAINIDRVRDLYGQHRNFVWFCFCVLVLGVTLSNAYLGIYQRGAVPRTLLPYGLSGIVTWFLLFGASSIAAVLLHFDLQLRLRISYCLVLMTLLETFFSNISMLSRGMVLNSSALLFGTYVSARAHNVWVRFRTILMVLTTLLLLFIASIFIVNQMRLYVFGQEPAAAWRWQISTEKLGVVGATLSRLIMDRWVGMEGVMAVSSYPDLGSELWKEVWEEKYSEQGTSLYDRKISVSYYTKIDLSNRHFISVPGILAFFYYPGSYGILFLAMLALGVLGAGVESAVYRWGGGNLILCSLIALVVAYRYVHFGYVPGQSYLLFGAIVLNVALIYVVGRVVGYRNDVRQPESSID